jgi:putative membrane protein
MLQPTLEKNDKKAKLLIWTVSIVVFVAVALMSRYHLNIDLPFNVHVFAIINAGINSLVAILLVAGLVTVKSKNYLLHKRIMLGAILLSVLFLVSYICHHLMAGETKYGDIDHDGILSLNEKMGAGTIRLLYYVLLGLHIPLAAIILPFILFTAYRSLTGDYEKHKKLARVTWPIWFFVAVSGVLVYWMISPFYN